MANESPAKKGKKVPLRLELNAPPPEMGNAISNVFGKLLGRPLEKERIAPPQEILPIEPTSVILTADAKMTPAVILSEPPPPMAADAKTTTVVKMATPAKTTEVISIQHKKGETSFPNFILDGLLPLLDPTASLVYLRLYRLSYGFQSNTCTVGIGKLASSLNLGDRTVERAIAKLEAVGLVKRLGSNFGKGVKGNNYQINLPDTFGQDTSAKMTPVVKATEGVKMTRAVNLATNKHDDDEYIKENHHQSAHARVNDDEDSSFSEHQKFVMSLYEKLTGNTWKVTDTESYQEIAGIPETDIENVMQQTMERATNHPNSLKFFLREIKAVEKGVEKGRERQVQMLLAIAKEVRSINTGRNGYTETDFREDIKTAAARKGIRYTPSLIDETIERLKTSRR